jgi:chaperonin cofactor prefoldin
VFTKTHSQNNANRSSSTMSKLTELEESYRDSQQRLFEMYQMRNQNIQMSKAFERERRVGQIMNAELKSLPQDNNCYKSIGRMYVINIIVCLVFTKSHTNITHT